jgi:hypothetical protein
MTAINKLVLAEMQEAEAAQEQQSFRVTDKGSADWCLRKIAAYRAEMAENQKLVQAETERLQQWLKAENEKAEQSIAYFSGLLEEWLRAEHERDERKRSISLPHGRIRLRRQQPEYVYQDEQVLPFLKAAAPDLVQTEVIEKYSKSNLKAYIKKHCNVTGNGVPVVEATGEVMPGVQITERPPKFEIETEGM